MNRIAAVRALEDYRLELTFSDGTRGVVDLSDLSGRGVFAPWTDYEFFRNVSIGEFGELVWPGDIDLCPDSLYLKMTGKEPKDIFPNLNHSTSHA